MYEDKSTKIMSPHIGTHTQRLDLILSGNQNSPRCAIYNWSVRISWKRWMGAYNRRWTKGLLATHTNMVQYIISTTQTLCYQFKSLITTIWLGTKVFGFEWFGWQVIPRRLFGNGSMSKCIQRIYHGPFGLQFNTCGILLKCI